MFPKTIRILVVDDMAAMRMRISNQIKGFGFTHIDQAENGQQAWEKIESSLKEGNPFKLVVSDWNMPELSGVELLEKLRNTYKYKNLPFLMVTAEGEKEQVIRAIKSGVSDYVVKPVSKEDLEKKLENVWKKHNK